MHTRQATTSHRHHTHTKAAYDRARHAIHKAYHWLSQAHHRAHSTPARRRHYQEAMAAYHRAIGAYRAGRWWDVVGDSATAVRHAHHATRR